jgi:hypothetical protein
MFVWCLVLGLMMLVCGLTVPAHLRAVDSSILQKAGRNSPALVEHGLELVHQNNLGAAQLTLRAAKEHGLPDWERLDLAVNSLASQHPEWQVWGGGLAHLDAIFNSSRLEPTSSNVPATNGNSILPLTEWAVRFENRTRVLELLRVSQQPAVQELLRFRSVTNTAFFPPSESASGQALDTAIAICGLLFEEGCVGSSLSNSIFSAAAQANRGGNTERLEQMLMDFMSLGQRMNWSQLATFTAPIENAEALRLQAGVVRKTEPDLPVVFSAVELSGKSYAVANYLVKFSQTGMRDLGWALRSGNGGINELLRRDQQLYISRVRPRLAGFGPLAAVLDTATDFSWRMPGVALALKWICYVLSGFLMAAALHFSLPEVSALERPLQVRGFHLAREGLFGLGFLLVVLMLSEPFLSQQSQRVDFPFRLRLPTVGSAVPAGSPGVANATKFVMNQSDLLPLLLFFVLQGLLYTGCLVKLAEIRRQRVPARIKLRLLENEDHLFDAGLYLGFLGTIVSFILYSTGVMKQFSLMVAYSSTSFGIVFVSIFKIMHLRPARRRLVLEAEAASTPESSPRQAAYATT